MKKVLILGMLFVLAMGNIAIAKAADNNVADGLYNVVASSDHATPLSDEELGIGKYKESS